MSRTQWSLSPYVQPHKYSLTADVKLSTSSRFPLELVSRINSCLKTSPPSLCDLSWLFSPGKMWNGNVYWTTWKEFSWLWMKSSMEGKKMKQFCYFLHIVSTTSSAGGAVVTDLLSLYFFIVILWWMKFNVYPVFDGSWIWLAASCCCQGDSRKRPPAGVTEGQLQGKKTAPLPLASTLINLCCCSFFSSASCLSLPTSTFLSPSPFVSTSDWFSSCQSQPMALSC